jgi:7-cyano-7-deazaguanine synthase
LLSGGLDSVVNFKCAIDRGEVRTAMTFDYGQAAFENERFAAADCALRYGVPHQVVRLPWYGDLLPDFIRTGRQSPGRDSPSAQSRDWILEEMWVPNRNGVFASVGAALAEFHRAEAVVLGLNREEAAVFPDNSERFVRKMNETLKISTLSGVEVVTFTGDLTKPEIIGLGKRIEAPIGAVYSCYRGSPDQRMCGVCQSCTRLKAALEGQGLDEIRERFLQ